MKFPKDLEHCLILPENRLSQKAMICKHLLDGAPLTHVYRYLSGKYKWRFFCSCSYPQCLTSVVTLGEVLERFPEIETLLKTTFDCALLLYRDAPGVIWHREILE